MENDFIWHLKKEIYIYTYEGMGVTRVKVSCEQARTLSLKFFIYFVCI